MPTRWTIADIERLASNGNVKIPELAENYSAKEPKNIPARHQQAFQALGRMKEGRMNKTEELYALLLERRKQAGEVRWYQFGAMNLRLAGKCYYKIDFMVQMADGTIEVHEVKGRWTDDALVKIKVAAETFPFFRFISAQHKKGQWNYRQF